MYSSADFAPLSPASMKKLLRGHTVRVKHGSGLKLHLSRVQHKKHHSSKLKGKGYNLTFDPYQMQMHGKGFFDDVGNAFKSAGNSFVENVAPVVKPVGRKIASTLIHQGIPMALSSAGGAGGTALGSLSANPFASAIGGLAGSELGSVAGNRLADYIGKKTGYGLMDVVKFVAPHAKKALIHVGKELGKQALSKGLEYAQKKALEHGVSHETIHKSKEIAHHVAQGHPLESHHMVHEVVEGALKHHPHYYKVQEKMRQMFGHGIKHHKKHKKMKGGTALIDQPFTVREAVDVGGRFIKDPAKTLGFGLKRGRPKKVKKGGTLLIDQPFTVREAVNTGEHFIKDPTGTFGFGLKHKHGGALLQAGYGMNDYC